MQNAEEAPSPEGKNNFSDEINEDNWVQDEEDENENDLEYPLMSRGPSLAV